MEQPTDNAVIPTAGPYQALLDQALVYYYAKDFDNARILSDQLLSTTPTDHAALQLAGAVARSQNRLPLAAELFKQALNQAPDSRSAGASWCGLGKTLRDADDLRQAEEALRRAIRTDPDRSGYVVELAETYAEDWKLDLALEVLKKAIHRFPSDPLPCAALAAILSKNGRQLDAMVAYDLALKRRPTDSHVHLNKGATLKILGRFAEAETEIQEALRLNPLVEAYSHLAQLKNFAPDAPEVQGMMRQWDPATKAPLDSRIDAGFALSKVYEKFGDYDTSFHYLEAANKLKRATIKFAITDYSEMFEQIAALFTPDFFARYAGKSSSALAPIFVLGMPRSGTTLTEQILASHSNVEGGGELDYMIRIAKKLGVTWESRGESAPGSDATVAQDISNAARDYGDMTAHLWRKHRRFTDKMPMNFICIGVIHLLFPEASIIYCKRNPAAICLSCYQMLFGPGNLSYTYDLKELGQFYKIHEQMMRHWNSVLPGRILEVEYETLVEKPEAEIRRILSFCQLDFEVGCLDFHKLQRPVATASLAQVRKPIYKEAVNHWKNYQSHLGPLFDALGMNPQDT